MKPYRVVVFGKPDCDKCKVLNRRLDGLLATKEWEDFEKVYCDVTTEDGLVEFSRAECINPQRIPAFMIKRQVAEGCYEPVPNPQPNAIDPVCQQSRLYQHLGIQTDYTDVGKGLITVPMITSVLGEARGT